MARPVTQALPGRKQARYNVWRVSYLDGSLAGVYAVTSVEASDWTDSFLKVNHVKEQDMRTK